MPRIAIAHGHRQVSPAGGGVAKSKRVSVLTVACPSCRAEPGHRCVGEGGEEVQSTHRVRQRMATRAANLATESGYSRFLSFSPAERKEIRKAAGLTQAELGRFLGLAPQQVSDAERVATPSLGRDVLTLWGLWLVRMADRS